MKADINQNNSMLYDAQSNEKQSTHPTNTTSVEKEHGKKVTNTNGIPHRKTQMNERDDSR